LVIGAAFTQSSALSTPSSVITWIDKTNAKLETINSKLTTENYFATWTPEEITAFDASLTELKKTILALLKIKPATPATTA